MKVTKMTGAHTSLMYIVFTCSDLPCNSIYCSHPLKLLSESIVQVLVLHHVIWRLHSSYLTPRTLYTPALCTNVLMWVWSCWVIVLLSSIDIWPALYCVSGCHCAVTTLSCWGQLETMMYIVCPAMLLPSTGELKIVLTFCLDEHYTSHNEHNICKLAVFPDHHSKCVTYSCYSHDLGCHFTLYFNPFLIQLAFQLIH